MFLEKKDVIDNSKTLFDLRPYALKESVISFFTLDDVKLVGYFWKFSRCVFTHDRAGDELSISITHGPNSQPDVVDIELIHYWICFMSAIIGRCQPNLYNKSQEILTDTDKSKLQKLKSYIQALDARGDLCKFWESCSLSPCENHYTFYFDHFFCVFNKSWFIY